MTPSIHIHHVATDPTTAYAVSELARCLGKMTGRLVETHTHWPSNGHPALRVGAAAEMTECVLPEVEDATVDDAIYVDVEANHGIIAGNNRRSVLLAVYRYLHELGCRWLRPGPTGEQLPRKQLENHARIAVSETAAHRHRMMVIEGAISLEHALAMIEWCPRAGYNGYLLQFHDGHTFFRRWYEHSENPSQKGPHRFTREMADQATARVLAAIEERSMLLHTMGHGWTTRALDLPTRGWDKYEGELNVEQSKLLAKVDGERRLQDGVPLSTNLCYAQPQSRRRMINAVLAYLETYPQVDYLHFYIADGLNNTCECNDCQGRPPADDYVKMLNELDVALDARGLTTRIVFLIYVDLLWPPEQEKIAVPERFVLMFAPITRTFASSFANVETIPKPPVYERNNICVKGGNPVSENLSFLQGWQATFSGDAFDFDYHYWQFQYDDFAGMQMAKVAHDDVRALKHFGMQGFASCQTQRAALPTALGPWVIGQALWHRHSSFDVLVADYFRSAFGINGEAVANYLTTLGHALRPSYLRQEEEPVNPTAAASFSRAVTIIDTFAPTIDQERAKGGKHHFSWLYLKRHAELSRLLALTLHHRARGNNDAMQIGLANLERRVWELEPEIGDGFDAWLFVLHLRGRLKPTTECTVVIDEPVNH